VCSSFDSRAPPTCGPAGQMRTITPPSGHHNGRRTQPHCGLISLRRRLATHEREPPAM
jgi:hypothetical protein